MGYQYYEADKVRAFNSQSFIKDFKRVRNIVILAASTCVYLSTTKLEVWETAKFTTIRYKLRTDIYKDQRETMIIY